MAKGGKAKKKARKKTAGTGPDADGQESTDELLALEAIYPEAEVHEDRAGFSLRVVPSSAETCFCAVTLK